MCTLLSCVETRNQNTFRFNQTVFEKWVQIGENFLDENYDRYKDDFEIGSQKFEKITNFEFDPSQFLPNEFFCPTFGCLVLCKTVAEKSFKMLSNDLKTCNDSNSIISSIDTARILLQLLSRESKSDLLSKMMCPLVYDFCIQSVK